MIKLSNDCVTIKENICTYIIYMIYIWYSAKWWWGKTLVNLVNLKQFTKIFTYPNLHLKTVDSWLWKSSLGKNAHDVYLEILSSCRGEARSPRSQWPLRETVPPTATVAANVKVNEALNEAEVKKSTSKTHGMHSFLMPGQGYEVGKGQLNMA